MEVAPSVSNEHLRAVAAAAAAVLLLHGLPAVANPVEDGIRQRVEVLRSGATLEVDGQVITSTTIIPLLYERRGFTPAWKHVDALGGR